MQDLDERNITEAVLATLSATPNRRMKEVMTSLVRHLHDFARDVSLTPTEWIAAVEYLTKVGQTCSPTRQEFILLSDTLGLSALINVMNSRAAGDATTSSLLGPFFREKAPVLPLGGNIAVDVPGEVIAMSGRVHDAAGKPIAGASLDVWQTSSDGLYDIQGPNPSEMNMRGRFQTDPDGRYRFRTIAPRGYSIPVDGPVGALMRKLGRDGSRPAHIHFLIAADGCQELATALYLDGDPHIDSDAVFGVSRSLVVKIEPPSGSGPTPDLRRIRYDFALARATGAGSQRVGADPASIMPAAE
jgi:protocatechuate 3,4-dioxygenase beta subunit